MTTTGKMDPSALWKLGKNSNYNVITAIEEHIDNAIDAKAKNVYITFDSASHKLTIADDGIGMNDEILSKYLIVAATTHGKSDDSIGAFGIGGLAGCAYLADEHGTRFKISTHKEGMKRFCVEGSITEPAYTHEDIEAFDGDNSPIGTTIEIENTLVTDDDIAELRKLIAEEYFPTALFGANFWINGIMVVVRDPLYRNHKKMANLIMKDSVNIAYKGVNYPIEITFAPVGLADFTNSDLCPFDKGENKKGGVSTTSRSGVYMVFGNRYITHGGDSFSSILGKTHHTDYNGLRVEFTIPKILRDLFAISWAKGCHSPKLSDIKELNPLVEAISDYCETYRDCKVEKAGEEKINKIYSPQMIKKFIAEWSGVTYKDTCFIVNSETDSPNLVDIEDGNHGKCYILNINHSILRDLGDDKMQLGYVKCLKQNWSAIKVKFSSKVVA